MPAFTILIMRKDDPGRRPLTVHISSGLLWSFIILAIGLPVVGFLLSAGWLAPTLLKLDFKNMKQAVVNAEQNIQPLQKQNSSLASLNQRLVQQLQAEREARASAEAKLTMAETAHGESSGHLTELEGEVVDLKRSVAVYERLLKPKMAHEMLDCVDISITPAANQVNYEINFAKVGKTQVLPASLTARIHALAGDNAVTLSQTDSGRYESTQMLNPARSLKLQGAIAAALPAGTTRVLDIKVYDGSDMVASCWKMF
jgi:hypothetical protein